AAGAVEEAALRVAVFQASCDPVDRLVHADDAVAVVSRPLVQGVGQSPQGFEFAPGQPAQFLETVVTEDRRWNGRAQVSGLRLNILVADLDARIVFVVQTPALATGAEGAGLARILRTHCLQQAAWAYVARNGQDV